MEQEINFSLKTKLFTLFAIVIVVSVSFIGWFGFNSAKDAYMKTAMYSSKSEIKSLANQIKGLLDTVPEDVIYNEGFYALEQLLVWEDLKEPYKIKEWKNRYESSLIDYIKNKKLYYQVRLLDTNGHEKIVLKYDETTGKVKNIKNDKLQNKSTREYFKKAINLKKDEFYISIMNLNVEHGGIEKPYVPVVRYSTPVIDENGETKGVLVLNFSANKILDMIKNIKIKDKTDQYNYFLLNKDGDYLYTKNKDKRWGFQLGRSYKFQDDFGLDILKKFKNVEKITFHSDRKIISVLKIYPNKQGNPNRFWYLINTIDEDIALSSLEQFIQIFFVILSLVLLIGLYLVNRYVTIITNPLIKITSQLKALSLGETKKEDIAYKADDEIGAIVKSTKILVDAIETTINQANSVASGDFSKQITLLSKNDQLGLAITDMTKRLKEISNLAKNLSTGNYDIQIVAKSGEDELGLALIDMIKYLENITKVAESIAAGNIDIRYKAQGSEDRLGYAILQMIKYLKRILKQANAITNEDFTHTITAKGKNDELGNALVSMTNILGANVIKNKEEIWLSEGIGTFSDTLTGIDNTLQLTKKAITMCTRYVNATSGVVYTFDDENKELILLSSFAFVSKNNLSNRFKIGEGIIGQVALEKEPILLKNIKDDTFEVQSGTTLSKPKEVFAFPLIHEGELFGVIELMSFEEFTTLQKEYLLKIANIFATALHTTNQNVKIKTLLEESQRAFEELQIKSEEIESAKEEIDKKASDLEASNQYKSEFLANMSHELRTPLNSVILLSSLLAKNNKENLNEADIQKANVINESGNELLRLINDILDLSKVESGKMELIVDEIVPKNLLSSYDEVFIHTARDKGLEFKTIDNYGDTFYNDKDRLGQIIRNLISNAFKFTKEGSVTLEISKSNNEKLPIKICVTDTGIGIPKEKKELIFKAFTQADGSTSREFGGTGLGLSISKELVHLMQGEIELESIQGEGSVFCILLPSLNEQYNVVVPDTPVAKKMKSIKNNDISDEIIIKNQITQIRAIDYSGADINNLKDKKVLIVDDDIKNIFVLSSALQEHDMYISHAKNGQEALDFLKENNDINIVLMDIMMPVMDGYEAMKRIRKDETLKHIPIIAVTAKAMQKDIQDAFDSGANDYLTKPIDLEKLGSMMAMWINKGQ